MNAEQILAQKVTDEIDIQILREICETADVSEEETNEMIARAQSKMDSKIDRWIKGLTNKDIHGKDNL